METYLIYIGKAALAAGAFYLVYLALFQNQKQFTFNRIYLPVSLALSFAIPLITFTTVNYVEAVPVESNPLPVFTESYEPVVMQQSQSQFIWEWYHYLFAIYTAGTALFLFRLLMGHGKAWNIIHKSRVQQLFNSLVNISKKDIHPFSFFNKIVLSENTLSHPNLKIIVEHENIHVKEKHTLDILFTELLFLLQWFNPFAWLLKDAVKNNLEYKTDNEIAKTTDAQTYQLAMLALADKQGVAPFLTALNGSQLKSRIIMMKRKTPNKYARLKQLVILPLLAVLVMGLAEREVKTEFIHKEEQVENIIDKAQKIDFSKLKIVVDGKEIPTDSPELKDLKITQENLHNSKYVTEIVDALNIDSDDIKTSKSSNNPDDPYVYIRTKNYVPGTNLEFEKQTATPEIIRQKLQQNKNSNEVNSQNIFPDNNLHSSATNDKIKPGIIEESVKFLISIEFQQNQLILEGLEGCAFTKLAFSTIENKSVAINQFGIASTRPVNSTENSSFLFEIEKINDQIKLIGKVGTAWKELNYGPTNQKHYISESRVSQLNNPLFVVDGVIGKISSIDDINPADLKSVNVLKDEKAIELYGEKGKNGVVIITTKNNLNGASIKNTIQGKVTNEKGEPIDGASVVVEGRKFGVVTNSKGNYQIEIEPTDEVLIFGYLYHDKQKVKIDSKDEIDVQIHTDRNPPTSGSFLTSSFKMRNSRGDLVTPVYLVNEAEVDIEEVDKQFLYSFQKVPDSTATKLYGQKGRNGVIILKLKNPEDLNTISGKITNEKGEPVAGATIAEYDEPGSAFNGTLSDKNGNYVYVIKRDKPVIKVVHFLYETKELNINGNKVIDVQLEKKAEGSSLNTDKEEDIVIGNINWINNEKYSSVELTNALGVKKGDVYSKEIIEERAYGEVSNLYMDNGYLFFNIKITEKLRNDNTVDLGFTLYEGTLWKIGKIDITGNKAVSSEDYLNKIEIRPGDVFSRSKLIQSVRSLNEMINSDTEIIDVEVNPDLVNQPYEFNTVHLEFKIAQK